MANSKPNVKPSNDLMIAFERGELDIDETVCLFSDLLITGLVYQLRGVYTRMATDLIRAGYLDESGAILSPLEVNA